MTDGGRRAARIALILPDFSGGGAQRVMLSVAGAAIADGRQVRIVVMNGAGPLAASVPAGAAVEDLGSPRLRGAIPGLRRAIRGAEADAVLAPINYLNIGVMLAMLGARRPPVILREANQPSAVFAGDGLGKRARLAATRFCYPRAAALVSPSAVVADEMAGWYRVPRDTVQVIPNPVDAARLRTLAAAALPARDAAVRFVAAGRVTQ